MENRTKGLSGLLGLTVVCFGFNQYYLNRRVEEQPLGFERLSIETKVFKNHIEIYQKTESKKIIYKEELFREVGTPSGSERNQYKPFKL